MAVLALYIAEVMLLGQGCGYHTISKKQELLDRNWVASDSPVDRVVEDSSTQTTDHVQYLLSTQPEIDADHQVVALEVPRKVTRRWTTTQSIAATYRHDLNQRTVTTKTYVEPLNGKGLFGAAIGIPVGVLVAAALPSQSEGAPSSDETGRMVGVFFGSIGIGALIGLGIEAAANTRKSAKVTEEVVDTKLVTKRSPETTTREEVVSRDLADSVDVGVESDFLSEGSAVLRPINGVLTIPFELGYPYALAEGNVDAASRISRHLTRTGCRSATPSRVQPHIQAVVLPLRVWTISGDAADTQDAESNYEVRVYKATEGIEAAVGCK